MSHIDRLTNRRIPTILFAVAGAAALFGLQTLAQRPTTLSVVEATVRAYCAEHLDDWKTAEQQELIVARACPEDARIWSRLIEASYNCRDYKTAEYAFDRLAGLKVDKGTEYALNPIADDLNRKVNEAAGATR